MALKNGLSSHKNYAIKQRLNGQGNSVDRGKHAFYPDGTIISIQKSIMLTGAN